MPFDRRILDFYDRLHRSFAQHRPAAFGHINFVSIGGSANDKLIRADLVSLASDNPLDLSILTTAIDDVGGWGDLVLVCGEPTSIFLIFRFGPPPTTSASSGAAS